MISYGVILPHSTNLLSNDKETVSKLKKTHDAILKVSEIIKKIDFDSLLIITPHGPVGKNAIPIYFNKKLSGELKTDRSEVINLKFSGDTDLAGKIAEELKPLGLQVSLREDCQLDYGVLVPLYNLFSSSLHKQILPISTAYVSRQALYRFGQAAGQAAEELKRKIVVIASADLSHRLSSEASEETDGSVFDKKLIKLIKENDVKGILTLDRNIIENAHECAMRSIAILMGFLDGLDVKTKVLSYEAPFGIGHMVSSFEVKHKRSK
jgi:aromatic ring-opening dioxygenase LigB subunit